MIALCQLTVRINGDCRFFDRSSKIVMKLTTSLIADKLFEIKLTSNALCANFCTATAECFYLTVDVKNEICTLYKQGSNYYNTTNLYTYVLDTTWTEVFHFEYY